MKTLGDSNITMDYADALMTPKRRPNERAMLILRVDDSKSVAGMRIATRCEV